MRGRGSGEEITKGPGALFILGAVLLLLTTACGSARQVLVEPGGGVVALTANSNSLRKEALGIIAGQCRGGYEITLEEEVPVGSRVREETVTDLDRRDRITSTTSYYARTKYEWRIHYRCQ
jgi:hypothetical protein